MTRDINRPRIARTVTNASSFIELESFRLLETGADVALLVLRGRINAQAPAARPVGLIVRRGVRERWLAAMPAPAGTDGTLSAVFWAPVTVTEEEPVFSLQLDDGSVLELPAPRRASQRSPSEDELAELRERLLATDAQLAEARSLAGTMAAEVEEAQTRADGLAEVVRAETVRREALQKQLIEQLATAEAARADAEEMVGRLEQELLAAREHTRP